MENKHKDIRKTRKILGGFTGKGVIIPAIVIVIALFSVIIYANTSINRLSDLMSTTMRNYSKYVSEATTIQGGASSLSEQLTSFVLMPTLPNGNLNIGPLTAFASEVTSGRRGYEVMSYFKNYTEIGEETMESVSVGAYNADIMYEYQKHALALMRSAYTLPDIPALKSLPDYDLTEEEKNLSQQEKVEAASSILLSQDYSLAKSALAQNLAKGVSMLREESDQKSDAIMNSILKMRYLLWIMTTSIIIALSVVFYMFYRLLISPLSSFAKGISLEDALKEKSGLFEIRLLASAYNGLLKRRNKLETALRSQAETDALTGLPNRLSYNQYLITAEDSGCSYVLILFDINYLKTANDKYGHLAGDELIKKSANYITSIFSSFDDCKCFRIGGDEFATILKNCDKKKLEEALKEFVDKQKENKISIAYGYSYVEDIATSDFEVLFKIADGNMYQNKQDMHANDACCVGE